MVTTEREAQEAITDHDVQEAMWRATELRDAAINASASAWRVTGLDVCDLIAAGADFGQPVSLEELAFASSDGLGCTALGARAREIAETWTRAAESWQAAGAYLESARPGAIAELRRQHIVQEQLRTQQNVLEQATPQQERLAVRPESFHSNVRPTYRTVRRPMHQDRVRLVEG